jgi:FAD:protein FMN transferase
MINMKAQSTHFGMGTVMSHQISGKYAEECLSAVLTEVKHLEGILSRFLPESDISRINRSAGVRSEAISPETMEVLSQALRFSDDSQGAFDISIGPLVSLWNNGQNLTDPPDPAAIRQTLSLVNFEDLRVDSLKGTAGLRRKGQSIDLGGIGKGFAGDRILDVFRDYGITSAYSNLGGNVVTLGSKPDGSPWKIGIQHPRMENQLIGVVSVAGKSIVTSGDYQRCFTGTNGKRYHHILDPLTGHPSESGLISATVVAENSMQADALSTILFVSGLDKGLEILRNYPDTEAICIDQNLQVFITPGLEDSFQTETGTRKTVVRELVEE